jgi:hypothetical protein
VGQSATLNGRRSSASHDELVNAGLGRAAASPRGLVLVASRGGMFPASASGRQAARLAQEHGLVRPLTDEMSGKESTRLWTVSEMGLAHWLKQTDPRLAVEALTDAVAGCCQELTELGKRADACQEHLARLSRAAGTAFSNLNPTVPTDKKVIVTEPANAILECLRAWSDAGDCPLPLLFKNVKVLCPDMSLGAFHDTLRVLRDRSAIHLHPWTGPLYELPDPGVALLAGHEIAYYASAREQG